MKASVGCVSQRTKNLNQKSDISVIPTNGALGNAPYKHDNMPYFSQKIFLNVKIIKKL